MGCRRPGTCRRGSTRLGDKITHVDLVKSRGRFTWNCRLHEGRGRRGSGFEHIECQRITKTPRADPLIFSGVGAGVL